MGSETPSRNRCTPVRNILRPMSINDFADSEPVEFGYYSKYEESNYTPKKLAIRITETGI